VQFCTGFLLILGKTSGLDIPELDAALTELRRQRLVVRPHNTKKDTWHIADGGLYSGYVAVFTHWASVAVITINQ
jgi:hypothetical protein